MPFDLCLRFHLRIIVTSFGIYFLSLAGAVNVPSTGGLDESGLNIVPWPGYEFYVNEYMDDSVSVLWSSEKPTHVRTPCSELCA